jgi:pimeloyl-ACP methyl ester carboxylesterase
MTMTIVDDIGVPPADGRFTTSDGIEIPYRVRGEGPPLLLIHGWSQSGAMFRHQLDGLSDRFRVIVPDLRGQGEATKTFNGLRMARLAQDIAGLIDHLGLGRVHLLGWSMGASLAWAYIDLFGTDRIDRLILVDQPSMLTILPDMDEAERIDCGAMFTLQQLQELCTALESATAEETRAAFVDGMVTPAIAPDLLAWIKAENRRTPPAVAARLLFSHCTNDWRDVLPRIDRPTLVIGGSVSHVNPLSQRYVASRIDGARYHEFGADEGGAHYPFLEAPAAFNRVVAGFLDQH